MIFEAIVRQCGLRVSRPRVPKSIASLKGLSPAVSPISTHLTNPQIAEQQRHLSTNIQPRIPKQQKEQQGQRGFSQVVAAATSDVVGSPKTASPPLIKGGWGPERFRTVPFVKEDLRSVIQEVPDVKYYYLGDEAPQPYPYKDIPVDQKIDYEVQGLESVEYMRLS